MNTEPMSEEHKRKLKEFLNVQKPTHGDVCWFVGGVLRERLASNLPIKLAYARAAILRRNEAYKPGMIKVV